MIRPLSGYELDQVLRRTEAEQPFPILDRAFDAVERALAKLGVEDPASLRTPRPVEEALSETALPDGTLLILNPGELRAAEVDIEDTVKDERLRGSVFTSVPSRDGLPGRARGLRELASVAQTFGFHPATGSRPPRAAGDAAPRRSDTRVSSSGTVRLGKLQGLVAPAQLRGYRFLLADTPGFRVCVVARDLPGGGFIALWSGNELVLREVRQLLAHFAEEAGYDVPPAASEVPVLEGVGRAADVWDQAEELRAYRVIRQAELREIARAAALRGVAIRREREARQRATGT